MTDNNFFSRSTLNVARASATHDAVVLHLTLSCYRWQPWLQPQNSASKALTGRKEFRMEVNLIPSSC